MSRIVITAIFSWEMDEADYPGDMDEADLREEALVWRNAVKRLIEDEGVEADIDDVTAHTVESHKSHKS